ncbi:MAG: preprotein translocase subunit SecE [Chromatiales bacterium]
MRSAALMNSKAEAPTSNLDTAKLWAASIVTGAAIVGFYYFSEHSLLVRVLGLLVAALIAGAIAYQTERGRLFAAFLKEAQIEVRKVVWPTREETVKTTTVVVAVVVLVAVALWGLDLVLSWLVRSLTTAGVQ